jgi:tetratricopeptide (TPR) repeat protein
MDPWIRLSPAATKLTVSAGLTVGSGVGVAVGSGSVIELFAVHAVNNSIKALNKKAIILSNQEKFEGALDALDKAISLQSLNAVNNKFTVLITAERYHEGYKYLESIIDTPNMTVLGLYNLAILYYRADYYADYKVDKNISKAYKLLVKAASLPNDEREVGREHTRTKVTELISQLEQEGEYW